MTQGCLKGVSRVYSGNPPRWSGGVIVLDVDNPKFLCVGLGETSKLSVRHLQQKGYSNIKVSNRTNKKAKDFADELGFDSIEFNCFKDEGRLIWYLKTRYKGNPESTAFSL